MPLISLLKKLSNLSKLKKFKKLKILKKPPVCTALIAAAGSSLRCKGEDKLFYLIKNKPVLAYTIEAFQKCPLINDIIIVAQENRFEMIADICKKYGHKKVSKIIKGGGTRPESVLNGLYAVSKKSNLVAIHDGARPGIDAEIRKEAIIKASKHHASAPAVPITSTIKKVDRDIITETVSREDLYEIQTPQVFRVELIKAALTDVLDKNTEITDDCMAVEILGVPVYITEGSRKNIKITDIDDLHLAEIFLSKENR